MQEVGFHFCLERLERGMLFSLDYGSQGGGEGVLLAIR